MLESPTPGIFHGRFKQRYETQRSRNIKDRVVTILNFHGTYDPMIVTNPSQHQSIVMLTNEEMNTSEAARWAALNANHLRQEAGMEGCVMSERTRSVVLDRGGCALRCVDALSPLPCLPTSFCRLVIKVTLWHSCGALLLKRGMRGSTREEMIMVHQQSTYWGYVLYKYQLSAVLNNTTINYGRIIGESEWNNYFTTHIVNSCHYPPPPPNTPIRPRHYCIILNVTFANSARWR